MASFYQFSPCSLPHAWYHFPNRIPEAAIGRAARTLLNLPESWEWATKEERRMLVRTMIQEAGCDVGSKRILWVKVNPDFEILFRLMNGPRADTGRRYWISEYSAEVDPCDTKGNRLIVEIAQQALSDLRSWQFANC